MSKRKLEATRANQARKVAQGRRTPPGYVRPSQTRFGVRRGTLAAAIGAAVLVIAVGAYLLAGRGSSTQAASSTAVDWNALNGMQSGPPPWTPGLDGLASRLQTLGLVQLNAEGGFVKHVHDHLDVYVNGKKATVPQYVGINVVQGFLTQLHTHDTTGVMHVESPIARAFTLGEFFGVWGVKLTPQCLGTMCNTGAKRVRVFLNGKPYTGNPTNMNLGVHQEVVVTYGTRSQLPKPIPSRYNFPAGE